MVYDAKKHIESQANDAPAEVFFEAENTSAGASFAWGVCEHCRYEVHASLSQCLRTMAALVSNWTLFIDNALVLGSALVCLMVTLLAVGFVVPLILGLSAFEAKTISIETGVQNSSLGIVIAALVVGGDTALTLYSIPAAVYGIVMYMVLIPALPWLRRSASRTV